MASAPAAAVVCEDQSEEAVRAAEAAVLVLEEPVVSSRRLNSSGVKRWSLFRCLGRGGIQGAWAGSGGGSGGQTCSSGGDDGICGFERGESYPFDPGGLFTQEVREQGDHNNGGEQGDRSSGGRSSSSSGGGERDDATWGGVSTHPFDRGKRSRWRRATRGAVLGVDLPFDRGKGAWGHTGG